MNDLITAVAEPWKQLQGAVKGIELQIRRFHAQCRQNGHRSDAYEVQQKRPPSIVSFGLPMCSMTAAGNPLLDTKAHGQKSQTHSVVSDNVNRSDEEERILISEVEVQGVEGALKLAAEQALTTKPNFGYTLKEVEEDLRRVFRTGWFSSCVPDAEDTQDGVKLIIKVTPNTPFKGLVASGANVIPNRVLQDAFRPLIGKTMNYVHFGRAVEKLDRWYQDQGVLGQVVDFDFKDGLVEMRVGEAEVGQINLKFLDKEGAVKSEGSTRPDIILRHLTTKPGQVYSFRQAKEDIDSIYSTGLFEDVTIVPQETEESTEQNPQVDLTINLVERKTGGLGAGTGISTQSRGEGALPGFVGSFSYSQRNLFGVNQKLSALIEMGQVDSVFRISHTDPWLVGSPHRTSRTIQLMNNRTSGNAIHGRVENEPGEEDASGPSGNVVLGRLISGVEFRQPLRRHWSGTAGLTWQRTKCFGDHGQPLTVDCYGGPLTFSGGGHDTLLVGMASAAYTSPRDSSQWTMSVEQALPLRNDWLNFQRLKTRWEVPVPVGPFSLNVRGRAGFIFGDLPPYEAFPIGGTNSVRGYGEGAVGSGRYCLESTSELRFPLKRPFMGTLFFDYGSDLDSGATVTGDPAGARGKPGKGYGYGGGVRVDSPLGPVRLEYAWNGMGQRRFHIGLGYD